MFLVSFVILDVETTFFFFFVLFVFNYQTSFQVLEKKKILKIENWEKNGYRIVGGQEQKATITSFEFRINTTNFLRMGDDYPQGKDHKDNW